MLTLSPFGKISADAHGGNQKRTKLLLVGT